jgi:coenzyme PQQ precursor peptide PqqA
LEIIISGNHIQTAELGSPIRVRKRQAAPKLGPNSRKESSMREWHEPTIEETESGMEVTSYLPAELDRA